ncbi:DUF6492 family protein [Rhodoferax sp. PAMC 29310]|uniref:DUF6492 family protein n=1 Tax=Rhodoferax sp. PAMC 29310 TaxID=2822760 RepID=UPI001B3389F5|nr:DUF6492 family protein [Rhodoferax sp. PAMC 29310]
MKQFSLFCKSFCTDLKRVVRLASSIRQFNTEGLPFYVSVPNADLPLFREHLSGLGVEIVADETIIAASPRIKITELQKMSGGLTQQIIKSEFWRLGISTAYLCLDSDALFIRPFGVADFMAPGEIPYTVIDEGHESLEDAIRHKKPRVVKAYVKEADLLQNLFERTSRRYSFGPFPLIWHRAVWESLDTNYLRPLGISIADAIAQAPIESRWYGEALLAYKAVPLMPCQPLFKVYHYAWQYDQDLRRSMGTEQLKTLYSGVIYQSAWERGMDWPREGGDFSSRFGRRLRRILGRI